MRNSINHGLLVSVLLPGALVFALLDVNSAHAQTTLGQVSVQGTAEVGVYPEPVPDTNVAKYREYSDLAQQIIAPELSFLVGDDKDDRVFADFRSYNLGQKNQMY